MIHEVLHMVTNIPATEEGKVAAMSEVQPRMGKAGLNLVTPPEESTALAVTKGPLNLTKSIRLKSFDLLGRAYWCPYGLGPAGSGSDLH